MPDIQKTAEPCVMVIFGATGDLTKRKLFPALYNLARDKFLSPNFAIVGVGRQEMTSDEFRKQMHEHLKEFAATTKNHPADEASAPLLKPGGELNPATPPSEGGELFVVSLRVAF